ncbi:hypothetical protein SBOR_7511 [Sclerotinia borealis F-4128]|uniref:MYND-type domain-containing protein n=1 Tax=Sclerotinia borealis (strain F-4128) TaxID=1432307 RepID=W9C8B4_SCLBF|nr:hypothetical protein SBOR_7511 [Sclerotinia borealis F-4128]
MDARFDHTPAEIQCTSCKKPGYPKVCAICKVAPALEGDADVPRYCNTLCQQADWNHHKKTCKKLRLRTQLYAATSLAQRIFYIYREITWAGMDVKEAKIDGEKMILEVVNDTHAHEWKPLSSQLFLNPKDRLEVLNFRACKEAVAWMVVCFHGLLNGTIKEIKKIVCEPKNPRRTITAGKYTTYNMDHELFGVILRSGERFAIDISGAQYGYYEPVVRWETYTSTRIEKILSQNVCPVPTKKMFDLNDYSAEHIASQMESINAKFGHPERTFQFARFFETVNVLFLEWQNGEDCSLEAIWKLPEDESLRKQKLLVDFVDWRLNVMLRGKFFTVNGQRLVAEVKGIWEHERNKYHK